MATILDIAKELGISPSTVSRALREESVVNAETIRRVKKIASKLNYVPNRNASMLRRNESRQIGVLIPDISNPVYGLLVKGIDDVLRPQGYHMCLSCTYRDPDCEASLLESFLESRCAGIILASQENSPSSRAMKQLKHFNTEERPVVLSGYQPAGKVTADVVEVDAAAGANMVIAHLVKLGHEKIAFLGGQKTSPIACERVEGYQSFLREYQCQVDPHLVLQGGYDHQTGQEWAAKISRMVRDRKITAVFCMNDTVAVGLVGGLLKTGLRIPDDVSVVGFDDIPEAQWLSVPLTTVSQKQYEIGCLCASRILSRITSKSQSVGEISIKPELIIRQSSGKVPA